MICTINHWSMFLASNRGACDVIKIITTIFPLFLHCQLFTKYFYFTFFGNKKQTKKKKQLNDSIISQVPQQYKIKFLIKKKREKKNNNFIFIIKNVWNIFYPIEKFIHTGNTNRFVTKTISFLEISNQNPLLTLPYTHMYSHYVIIFPVYKTNKIMGTIWSSKHSIVPLKNTRFVTILIQNFSLKKRSLKWATNNLFSFKWNRFISLPCEGRLIL